MGAEKKKSLRTRLEEASLLYRVSRGRGAIMTSGLLFTIFLTAICIPEPSFFHYLDNKVYDLVMAQLPKVPPTPTPVIVEIDEKSLAAYGQWPWPRYRSARLLDAIRADGAKGVGIDILYAEPDRTSPEILAKQLHKEFSINARFADIPAELMDHDRLLADVLTRGPFVLGFYFDFERHERTPEILNFMKPISLSVVRQPGEDAPEESLTPSNAAVIPLEVLSDAARWKGFMNFSNDSDGYIRRTPLLVNCRGQIYPSLALATLMQCGEKVPPALRFTRDGAQELNLGGVKVPLDQSGVFMMRYRGKGKTFPTYSAADVLEGRLPKKVFDGKIVFVGTAAAGLQDLHATPVDPAFPSIELHATVVDNILQGDFIRIPPWTSKLEIVLCLAIGVLSTLLLVWTSGVWIAIIIACLAAIMWYGSITWLSLSGVYYSPLSAFIVLFGNFSLLTPIKFWREERQKHFYHRAFSRYVAPTIVEQILGSPEKLSLVGEEKVVSVLFADIRGFTTLSERLSPTQVSTLLHAYFTPMTRIIMGNLGTMDKFIGDAIMAFWNAPMDIENHQRLAAVSAVQMIRKLEVLNETVIKDMGVRLDTGIGLHCGRVRVGNMGSEDLFDYTIIGDNVNVASRVEGLTREYDVPILMTESFTGYCGDEFVCQEVDTVRVKGRAEPVTVYTLYDRESAGALAPELELYGEALEHYKQGRFDKALRIFASLSRTSSTRKALYRIYRRRCAGLSKNPPEEGWNLVYPPKRS